MWSGSQKYQPQQNYYIGDSDEIFWQFEEIFCSTRCFIGSESKAISASAEILMAMAMKYFDNLRKYFAAEGVLLGLSPGQYQRQQKYQWQWQWNILTIWGNIFAAQGVLSGLSLGQYQRQQKYYFQRWWNILTIWGNILQHKVFYRVWVSGNISVSRQSDNPATLTITDAGISSGSLIPMIIILIMIWALIYESFKGQYFSPVFALLFVELNT